MDLLVEMRKDKGPAPVATPRLIEGEAPPLSYKVVLATRSAGPLQALTARHDRVSVDAYPVGPYVLLECHGPREDLESARGILERTGPVLYETRGSDRMALLFDMADDGERAIVLLKGRAAHVIPPVRWLRGEAHVTLLVEDSSDLRELRDLFPDGRLLSKRSLAEGNAKEALGSPLFLPGLTEKQARALVAAFDAGYYDFPRAATTEEVSTALGLARSTFEQHLNRAEHHVVNAMLPLVRMRAAGAEPDSARAREEALAVYSKFSRELGLYVRLDLLGGRVARVQLSRHPVDHAGADHPYLTRILEHVRTGKGDFSDIPLDLAVSPFDREVLDFLRTVPSGTTVTYGEIARRLGRPGAARAVGQAVARNPAVVVVPCHRVVPASGGLGEYSAEGGVATKRKLLEREGAVRPTKARPRRGPRPRT